MDFQILHGKATMLAVAVVVIILLTLFYLLAVALQAIEEMSGKGGSQKTNRSLNQKETPKNDN